ncbi:MAG TPA: hypothetical protein VFE28_10005 [Candidatus Krumholzibacteria bacterium]|jgi:hypothetical protein|nr:hypothetical protein [Candidatus Krumholzibacteria bacterium]
MLSRFTRLLVLSLILLSLASPGFAARRSSLGGNLLIKDTDDIFFLPQRVVDYNRLLTFDYGSSSGLGSGGMIWGSERMVFGAFSHRSDFLGAIPNAFFTIGDFASINNDGQNDLFGTIGAGPAGGPFQWLDLLFGFGSNTPMGIRLSVGRAQDDTNAPPAPEDKSGVTSVDVVFGLTMKNAIELSGEVSFASGTDEVAGTPGAKTETSPVGFAIGARKTATEESEDLQFGWLGNFSYVTGGSDVTGTTTSENDLTSMAFLVGLGPVYTPTERTSVATYGTFAYQRTTDKTTAGGTTSELTSTDYVIPGWNVAGEVELASWLQWRGGLVSRYVISNTKQENTGAPNETTDTSGLSFEWHTGVGFTLGNFKLDGYIDPSVITSGTDLLGNSNDLFGMVTASYGF